MEIRACREVKPSPTGGKAYEDGRGKPRPYGVALDETGGRLGGERPKIR